MQVRALFMLGVFLLAFTGGHPAVRAEGESTGGGGGQATPEAGAEFTTTVFTDGLDGAGDVDIWLITCPGPTTAMGAQVCDIGSLDDSFILSIVGDTPGILTQGDRGFISFPSTAGGCTTAPYTARPAPSAGPIKAYVSIKQTADASFTSYDLYIYCYGATTKNATAKLVRDFD